MRTLVKNKRKFHYAVPMDTEKIKDEWGNETGEVRKIYSEPIVAYENISAATGDETTQIFGNITSYSRVMVDSKKVLSEGCWIWFGIDTDKPHNYEVVKVADSKNETLVALQEVSVS